MQTDKKTVRNADSEKKGRQTRRQQERQTDRQTDRQDDSQKGRQRKKGVGGGGEYSGEEETER